MGASALLVFFSWSLASSDLPQVGDRVFEAWSIEEGMLVPGGDVRDRFTAYVGLGVGAVTRMLQDLPRGAVKGSSLEIMEFARLLSELLMDPPEGARVFRKLTDEDRKSCVLWYQISDGVDRAYLCGKALLFDERIRTLKTQLLQFTNGDQR